MIGGTLEYLVSSLPNLSFQDTKEIKEKVISLLHSYAGTAAQEKNIAEILDTEAHQFLSDQAFETFQKISLSNIHKAEFRNSENRVVSEFSNFMFETKTIIRNFRLAKRKNEKIELKESLETILNEDNPLVKEIQLLKYQWDKLEELSAGHFSDFESLVIYKLKLNILMRWWNFDVDIGAEIFERTTDKI